MDMVIGYGGVFVLIVLVLVVLERSRRSADSFSEYATGGRSFGSAYSTMAFLNTWLPGTIFISFAGYAASGGITGFYFVPYSLLATVLMFLLARPVNVWGSRLDLRTQADLLGARYDSRAVQVTAAVIGLIASFPWVVLGMQSLGLVFSSLSFGSVSATTAVVIGVVVLAIRQVWTVRFGARGVIISDMVQGIVAYGLGTLIAVGLLVWLVTHGHGLGDAGATAFTVPGPGSAAGPLYLFSITVTGAFGGWCWPDIFVRLFASRSVSTIQTAAVQAAPILLVFGTALTLMAVAASTLPGVAAAPDAVWFTAAGVGGVLVVTLAGVCVVAATMGNVGANLQALGAQVANDVYGPLRAGRVNNPRIGQVTVAVITVLGAACALATASSTHLIVLALISYQGIVQLAPTLFFGIFWRRGTSRAAVASMVTGFVLAALLQGFFPDSVPALGGLTSGVVAAVVNTVVYVIVSLAVPARPQEAQRVSELFDMVREHRAAAKEVVR
jgi:SSS family solute:Na+ symporter